MRRAIIYLRVSTLDQTTANQERELRDIADRMGCEVVKVYKDHGISGAKGRDKRPAFDKLCRDAARREFDMVMAWSVDRLGRSLVDLLGTLQELHAKEVDLYLHQQGLDTSTPTGRAMFGMLGVFAEFERALITERVRAGLARVKAEGPRKGKKPIGRPKLEDADPARAKQVRAMRARGVGVRKIARELGVGVGTVLKLTAQPAAH